MDCSLNYSNIMRAVMVFFFTMGLWKFSNGFDYLNCFYHFIVPVAIASISHGYDYYEKWTYQKQLAEITLELKAIKIVLQEEKMRRTTF